MKPAGFDYVRPATLGQAVDALAAGADIGDGGAKVLAGGQSLVPLLSMRLASPSLLVDLNDVAELRGVGHEPPAGSPSVLVVGAMTRHRDLVALVDEPLVATAASWVGHTAIRARGTIGGSLAHADPNAEWPSVALACDAVLGVVGPGGTRSAPVAGFFQGLLQTTLADDEILTSVGLVRPRRWGFAELARRHGDFALVLSVVTELAAGWRVVLGGVAGTPVRCHEAEAVLDGGERDPAAVAAAVAASPVSAGFGDLHASGAYRRAMAAELTARAVRDATGGPSGTTPSGAITGSNP